MSASKRAELGQIVIRPPEGMRERIKAAADVNKRSMNAEIVATLESKYPPTSSIIEKMLSIAESLVNISNKMCSENNDDVDKKYLEDKIKSLTYDFETMKLFFNGGRNLYIAERMDSLIAFYKHIYIEANHPASPVATRRSSHLSLKYGMEVAENLLGNPRGVDYFLSELESITGLKNKPFTKK